MLSEFFFQFPIHSIQMQKHLCQFRPSVARKNEKKQAKKTFCLETKCVALGQLSGFSILLAPNFVPHFMPMQFFFFSRQFIPPIEFLCLQLQSTNKNPIPRLFIPNSFSFAQPAAVFPPFIGWLIPPRPHSFHKFGCFHFQIFRVLFPQNCLSVGRRRILFSHSSPSPPYAIRPIIRLAYQTNNIQFPQFRLLPYVNELLCVRCSADFGFLVVGPSSPQFLFYCARFPSSNDEIVVGQGRGMGQEKEEDEDEWQVEIERRLYSDGNSRQIWSELEEGRKEGGKEGWLGWSLQVVAALLVSNGFFYISDSIHYILGNASVFFHPSAILRYCCCCSCVRQSKRRGRRAVPSIHPSNQARN